MITDIPASGESYRNGRFATPFLNAPLPKKEFRRALWLSHVKGHIKFYKLVLLLFL